MADGLGPGPQRSVALGVVAIEATIPVLLVLRRTRIAGVLVALVFHFSLALDRTHQFFDFSAVLVSLFLLFLPARTIEVALDRVEALPTVLRSRWSSGPELVRACGLAVGGLVVLLAAGPTDWPAPALLRNVGVVVWVVYGLAAIAFAAAAHRAAVRADEPLLPARTPLILLVIPILAVLNGLTPYLELKSAASWNMYSNLAVVDGASNHVLVRSGIPLTDAHDRLVEVTAADGVDLDFYIGSDWRLPELMLRDHIAERPEAVVTGVVDGQPVSYEGGSGGARPSWQRKLQVFRAVDGDGGVGCQPSFGPAR